MHHTSYVVRHMRRAPRAMRLALIRHAPRVMRHALCAMRHALGVMRNVVCSMRHAQCDVLHAPRVMRNESCVLRLASCVMRCVPYVMRDAQCFTLHVPCVTCHAPCGIRCVPCVARSVRHMEMTTRALRARSRASCDKRPAVSPLEFQLGTHYSSSVKWVSKYACIASAVLRVFAFGGCLLQTEVGVEPTPVR